MANIILSEYSSLERLRMYSQAAENLKRKHKEDSVKPCNNTVQNTVLKTTAYFIYIETSTAHCTMYTKQAKKVYVDWICISRTQAGQMNNVNVLHLTGQLQIVLADRDLLIV